MDMNGECKDMNVNDDVNVNWYEMIENINIIIINDIIDIIHVNPKHSCN